MSATDTKDALDRINRMRSVGRLLRDAAILALAAFLIALVALLGIR